MQEQFFKFQVLVLGVLGAIVLYRSSRQIKTYQDDGEYEGTGKFD